MPQGRDAEGQDGETVIEIQSKAPCPRFGFERPVRRRDDAGADVTHPVGADGLHLLVLQDAQELGLD